MGGGKNHHKHKKPGKSGNKPKPSSSSNDSKKPVKIEDISTEFQTIILDFLRDIDCSFPEYHETLARYLGYSHEMKPMPDELYIELYSHCRGVYPIRFFDILYKNESLFASEVSDASKVNGASSAGATNNANGADKAQAISEASVEFLPGVDFREIWATEDITENTKDIIWKYLQLILFSIVNNLSDMGSFGDTAKLFEAIDNNELKTKLEEVISEMGSMFGNAAMGDASGLGDTFKNTNDFMNQAFENANEGNATDQQSGGGSAGTAHSMPDASSIHEHLSGILNGKIGMLAKEIAEETAADLNLDMENETSMNGVFQKLLKNPGKLSGIIKTVGAKLDSKLKSGELKESEIMQEASELMSKMKNMPGMNNLASMLSKMGMSMPGGGGGMGGGGKVNFGAMQSQLNKNMKQAQMRERLLKKVQEKQAATAAATVSGATTAVFTSGEKPAKTPRAPATSASATAAAARAAPSAAPSSTAAQAEKQKND